MLFNVLPDVDALVAEMATEGVEIPLEAARALWDRAGRAAVADSGDREAGLALVRRLDNSFVQQSFDRQTSISTMMENELPAETERDTAFGVDAFQRTMRALGVRTHSDRAGEMRAHTFQELEDACAKAGNKTAARVLTYELLRRAFIEGQRFGTSKFGPAATRFYASNVPLSDVLNPAFASRTPTVEKIRQPILNLMIALETGVPNDVWDHVYIEEQADQSRMRRVTQGAEYPRLRLTVTDRRNRTYKSGVVLEITDEAVRRVAIDEIRFHLALIGARRALDKENMAYDVLVAGDGNSGTAATITDISSIGGVAGTVDPNSLFTFQGAFEVSGGYAPTIGIAPLASKVKLRGANFGSANFPLFLGTQRVFNGAGGPEELDIPPIYARDYADTGVILMTDASQNIGMAFEIGGAKQETDRWITRDINVVKLSDTCGFWIIDANATRGLDIES